LRAGAFVWNGLSVERAQRIVRRLFHDAARHEKKPRESGAF
jgi:hypothetical protein